MKKQIFAIASAAVFLSSAAYAQVQINKPVQLSSATAADRRITGIGAVMDSTDAVSAGVLQGGSLTYAAATGANDYALTLPVATGYTPGMMIQFKVPAANTAGVTLNVNNMGAVAILKNVSQQLQAGDIAAAQVVSVIYDGTNFQLLSQLSQVTNFTGQLSGDISGTQSATAISAGAVTSAAIAPGAVTSAKILDGTVQDADISSTAAIAYSKLNLAGSIAASDLNAGAAPSAGQVLSYSGSGLSWSATPGVPVPVTASATLANVTAVYMINAGNVTLTMPSNPTLGTMIKVSTRYNATISFPSGYSRYDMTNGGSTTTSVSMNGSSFPLFATFIWDGSYWDYIRTF